MAHFSFVNRFGKFHHGKADMTKIRQLAKSNDVPVMLWTAAPSDSNAMCGGYILPSGKWVTRHD